MNAPVARVIELPRERLGKVVPTDLDVRGHEIRDRRVPAAEHEVFARSFEVVVDDLEGAGPVPADDRLGISRLVVRVRDVGVDNGRGSAVQGEAPRQRDSPAAVDVHAVQDDVVRHLAECRLCRPVAEPDETAVAGDAGPDGDLEPDQTVVVGAGQGRDRRGRVRADHLREDRGVGRGDTCARGRQARVGGGGTDDDPARPALVRQRVIAREGRARLERDHVAGLGGVDSGLKVPARSDGANSASGGRRVSGVQHDARRFGQDPGGRRRRQQQGESGHDRHGQNATAGQHQGSSSHGRPRCFPWHRALSFGSPAVRSRDLTRSFAAPSCDGCALIGRGLLSVAG